MYVFLPQSISSDDVIREMSTVIGAKAKAGENKLELDIKEHTLTFIINNTSKSPLKFNYKSIPGLFETRDNIKYDAQYFNFDVHGTTGCMFANGEIIINPSGQCKVIYMNINLNNLNVSDIIGGKMVSPTGTYVFEPFTDYDKKHGY